MFKHTSLTDFPYRLWLLNLTLGRVGTGRQKQVCIPSGCSLTLGQMRYVGKPHLPTQSERGCCCCPSVISEKRIFRRARLLLSDLSNSFLILKIRLQRINGEFISVVLEFIFLFVVLFIQSHLLLFIEEASCIWSFLHIWDCYLQSNCPCKYGASTPICDRCRAEMSFKVAGIIYFIPYRLEIPKCKRCY